MTSLIDEQIQESEKKFNELDATRKRGQEQRAELDRQLNQIIEEQVMLKGEHRGLQALKDKEKKAKEQPELKTASPKNEKEKKK